jgi:Putative peptidoglycan binding domain/D-alanyl-D-alanine carboxypeptidase
VSANGHIPLGELAAIRGGYLRRDAAAAFNAMDHASTVKFNVPLRPAGPVSSYRTYAQQVVLWNLYRAGRGNLAAVPGTSNHGWGLAVDLATHQMRAIVDEIGAEFGWAKRWSDAPSEWWHMRYRPGVWHGNPQDDPQPHQVALGARGDEIAVLQQVLRARGASNLAIDGAFGPATQNALRAFQKAHNLRVTGALDKETRHELHVPATLRGHK